MTSFLILSTFLAIGGHHLTSGLPFENTCESELEKYDNCLGRATVLAVPEIPMFENVDMLDEKFCQTFKKDIKCGKKYNKCLRAFPRTIYGVAVNGFKKNFGICKTQESRELFVEHFKCFQEQNSTKGLSLVMNRLTVAFERVLTVPQNDMIPTLCCAYHEVIHKAQIDLEKFCSNDTATYFVKFVQSALSDPIDLLCGGNNDYETCMTKFPERMVSIKNATIDELVQEYKSTPIIPALQIVARLDEDI